MTSDLRKEIQQAINRHSAENGSNTPDFILAAYLSDCLAAFDKATNWRNAWYSPEGVAYDSDGTPRLSKKEASFVIKPIGNNK